jgi:hypothetical protein
MDVGAAPACLVESGNGLVIVIGGGLVAIEYTGRHDVLLRSRIIKGTVTLSARQIICLALKVTVP